MFCHQCGKEIRDDAKFCSACGAKVTRPADQAQASESEPEKIQFKPSTTILVGSDSELALDDDFELEEDETALEAGQDSETADTDEDERSVIKFITPAPDEHVRRASDDMYLSEHGGAPGPSSYSDASSHNASMSFEEQVFQSTNGTLMHENFLGTTALDPACFEPTASQLDAIQKQEARRLRPSIIAGTIVAVVLGLTSVGIASSRGLVSQAESQSVFSQSSAKNAAPIATRDRESVDIKNTEPVVTDMMQVDESAGEDKNTNFILSHDQAGALANQVAIPLLHVAFEEENLRNTERYDAATVSANIPTEISDFTTQDWQTFIAALGSTDTIDEITRGAVFGSGNAYAGNLQDIWTTVNATAFRKYFTQAFGSSNYVLEAVAALDTLQPEGNDEINLPAGPTDVRIVIDVPDGDVEVTGNQVVFFGQIGGTWGNPYQGWSAETDYINWAIILDVVQDPSSEYGCYVTGFQIRPNLEQDQMTAYTSEESSLPIMDSITDDSSQIDDAVATARTGMFDEDGFIFADSSIRYLTDADLAGLSPEALAYARNEIFARNGNLFRKDKYINHYNKYDWYASILNKRYDVNLEDLNDVERANVRLIQQYEATLG